MQNSLRTIREYPGVNKDVKNLGNVEWWNCQLRKIACSMKLGHNNQQKLNVNKLEWYWMTIFLKTRWQIYQHAGVHPEIFRGGVQIILYGEKIFSGRFGHIFLKNPKKLKKFSEEVGVLIPTPPPPLPREHGTGWHSNPIPWYLKF